MIILLNGNQKRFRKALSVVIGRTQPPTATAIICMKTHLFHYYPTPNPINNADDKPADKVQDRKRKYDELRTFVAKHYTMDGAEKTLEVARWYLIQGDDSFIDELLAKFRKLDGRL